MAGASGRVRSSRAAGIGVRRRRRSGCAAASMAGVRRPRRGTGGGAMSRDQQISDFLDRIGWGAARRSRLAGDASTRRYERLIDGPRRAVLMDAPPPEDVRPFARIAALLRELDLSAPEVLAADPEAGLLLLEDFGDELFSGLLDAGAPAEA